MTSPGTSQSRELGRDLLWVAAAHQILYLDASRLASTCLADTYETFAQDAGGDAQLRGETARSLLRLAEVGRILGDARHAVDECLAAREHYRALLKAAPGDPAFRLGLAESDILRGRALNARQRNEEALPAYRDAVATLKLLAADRPDRAEARGRLAFARLGLGIMLKDLNRPDDARAALDLAIREYAEIGRWPSARGWRGACWPGTGATSP